MIQRSIEYFLKRKPAAPPGAASAAKKLCLAAGGGAAAADGQAEAGAGAGDGAGAGEDVQERIRRNREAALAKLKQRKEEAGKFGGGLEPGWRRALKGSMSEAYFARLGEFLEGERKKGLVVYPPPGQIFSAFNHCSFSRTKVVIVGQDPYHGPRQAHGMCFSVARGVSVPPSLHNIYAELKDDIKGFQAPRHGCLEKWAQQGVLLLNTTLTVERGKAASHRGKGWERFTDAAIAALNQRKAGVVFLLWGNHAKQKGRKIGKNHHVLTAAHPSPLSANKPYGGWFGCRHFSKTNEILKKAGKEPIDWNLD